MQASLGVSRSQAADVLSVHLLEELPAAAELPSEVLREVMDSKDAKRYCSEDITSATNIGGETPGERKSFQKLLKQKVLTISQESAKAQNIHKPKANSDGNAAKKFMTDSDKGYWQKVIQHWFPRVQHRVVGLRPFVCMDKSLKDPLVVFSCTMVNLRQARSWLDLSGELSSIAQQFHALTI